MAMTLEGLVRDLLTKTVAQKPRAAFAQMLADSAAMDLRSKDGPPSREEAYERRCHAIDEYAVR